jgi:hypothetical protein
MIPHPDCTVAIDDQLTERFHACLLCLRLAQWMDVRILGTGAWCGCVCQRCYQDQGWSRVDALLAQRYGAGRGLIRQGSYRCLENARIPEVPLTPVALVWARLAAYDSVRR